MKWTLLAVLATVAACGSNSETPEQRLIGKWFYTNAAGTAGVGLQFNSDATYSAQILQLTSDTAGNDEVEKGIFSATDTSITCTPREYTCPGPDPVYAMTYSFNGDSLGVLLQTGMVAFSRNTNPPSSNFIITFGCFQSDGSFVTEALAPVSN